LLDKNKNSLPQPAHSTSIGKKEGKEKRNRVRTLFQKQISRTFPGLFLDFSRTQIDFSRTLKFTLALSLPRSQF